jgi:hypothetical protein
MALPDTLKNTTTTTRLTETLSSIASSGGKAVTTNTVDNDSNCDLFANIWVNYTFAATPSSNLYLEVYLLYYDGSGYEDGGSSVDPKSPVAGVVPVYADSGVSHKYLLRGIPIEPYKFKVLVKNPANANVNVSIRVDTYNQQVVD